DEYELVLPLRVAAAHLEAPVAHVYRVHRFFHPRLVDTYEQQSAGHRLVIRSYQLACNGDAATKRDVDFLALVFLLHIRLHEGVVIGGIADGLPPTAAGTADNLGEIVATWMRQHEPGGGRRPATELIGAVRPAPGADVGIAIVSYEGAGHGLAAARLR